MTNQLAIVNDAISARGTSGSARATDQLATALALIPGLEVERLRPPWSRRHSSALVNAARDGWWDLHGAGRAAGRADLFVSPCNIGRAPRGMPHLLVVYDVMVFENPEYFDAKFVRYFTALVPYSLRRADRVLTLSEHARKTLLGIAPGTDIHVITLPGRDAHRGLAPWPARPLVLMVGSTEPHKNHVAGIRAVSELRRRSGIDIGLRIVGPPGRAESRVGSLMDRHDPTGSWATRQIGLSDAEVDAAYGSSWLLLQPSLNEGYGLPLVEACQRGLPVVHSGTGAMSEVMPTGNAKSTAPTQLADAMEPLLDPTTWAATSRLTAQEAPRFSWSRFTAQATDVVSDLLPAIQSRR